MAQAAVRQGADPGAGERDPAAVAVVAQGPAQRRRVALRLRQLAAAVPLRPGGMIARLDRREAGAAQPGPVGLEGLPVKDQAARGEPRRPVLEVRRGGRAPHPVGAGEDAAGAQHPVGLGEEGGLVGQVAHDVLGEDHVEGRIGQRQGTRRRQLEGDAPGQPGFVDEAGGARQRGRLDVEAEHAGGAQLAGQNQGCAADAAAEVENFAAGDRHAVDDIEDFRRAAGREEALAIERLHVGEDGVAVLAGLHHGRRPRWGVPGRAAPLGAAGYRGAPRGAKGRVKL